MFQFISQNFYKGTSEEQITYVELICPITFDSGGYREAYFNINDDDHCNIPIYFYESGDSEQIPPSTLIQGWTEQGVNFDGTEHLSDFTGGYIYVSLSLSEYEQPLSGTAEIPEKGNIIIDLTFNS